MLRHRRGASDIARYFVDDGDDLRMTTSFLASEENSSIAGNASMAASVVGKRSTPSTFLKDPNSKEKDVVTDSSSYLSDDGSYDKGTNVEEPRHHRLRQISAIEKVINTKTIKKGLNSAEKLLSTGNVKTFLLNRVQRQPSFRASTKYQEMDESAHIPSSPIVLDSWPQGKLQRSIRSTRINLSTGRSLLVRQNAQVMGRPSAARQDWDIGTALSSSESFSSEITSSKRSERNLVWDDGNRSVRSDISRLTGDSFRSKRSDDSNSRAMYIGHIGGNILGASEGDDDTTNVSGGEDISNKNFFESFQEERFSRYSQTTSRNVAHWKAKGRDPRATADDFCLDADDDFSQISERNLRGANSDDGLFSPKTGIVRVRERVLSDSEFLFEMLRRKRLLKIRTGLEGSYEKEDLVCIPNTPTNLIRSASFSDFLFPPNDNELDHEQRQRCLSENNIQDIATEEGDGMRHLESFDFEGVASPNNQGNFSTAPAKLQRLIRDGASKIPALILPAIDRGIQLVRGGMDNGTDSIPLLSDHDSAISSLPARRLSDSSFEEAPSPSNGTDQTIRRPQTSSASGVAVKESLIRQATEPMRAPFQAISRVSVATANNAAKIIASALRQPAAASVPVRTSKANDYYWNKDDEDSVNDALHEVLWNLSDNDSFGDMF